MNQWHIDNDYRECPECGNILYDLYCGEHTCPCLFDKEWLNGQSRYGIVNTPHGDRITFRGHIVGGIDYGKEHEHPLTEWLNDGKEHVS